MAWGFESYLLGDVTVGEILVLGFFLRVVIPQEGPVIQILENVFDGGNSPLTVRPAGRGYR